MAGSNSIAGTCYQCGARVEPGKGQLIKNHDGRNGTIVPGPGKWLVRCRKCTSKPANWLPS